MTACEPIDTDWRSRLAELPYGSREALDLVETLCDRAEAGELAGDELDAAIDAFDAKHWEQLAARSRQAARYLEELERETNHCLKPGDLPKIHFTVKEVLAMKLADAMRAIRNVDEKEIEAELAESEARLTAKRESLRQALVEGLREPLAEVKMLRRLLASKRATGKKKGRRKAA